MIDGVCLGNAIISGANNITRNKSHIDELNIFPVPDGDTGTNMSMTIMSAVKVLAGTKNTRACEVAKLAAQSLLRGARGNSGVILSILFKGVAKGLENLERISGLDIVSALGLGVEAAYKSVMKPTEGTMLTVARVAYERGKVAAHFNSSISHVWSEVCHGAREALKSTPDFLPVLKKAGVVDAGGKGLCLVFEGMLSVFEKGIIIENQQEQLDTKKDDVFKSAISAFDDDIRFTYCTEFIVGKKAIFELDPMNLRVALEKIGDCVVVVDDEEIIKVHVHTENPGFALQEGLKFGELLTIKIENMKEQHRRTVEIEKEKAMKEKLVLEKSEPIEPVGFVAVAAGDGVHNLFKDLGCQHVISGGQTMNPSTDEILSAILATPAETVFVMPNNKNIIMAATQAANLVKDREAVVIRSKTVPQGISAILAYDSGKNIQENFEVMTQKMKEIRTGQITFASRTSEFGGMKIKEGDILALDDGKLIFTEKDPIKACKKLILDICSDETQFITVIYGEGVKESDADTILEELKDSLNPNIDITMVYGGQPIYYFTVSFE